MLWEMAVCYKPFKGMSVEQHADFVIHQGYRPKISAVPGSEALKKLMQSCWSQAPEERPRFTEIRLALVHEIESHRRQEVINEIERQRKIAPKTGALRMKMMRQRRSTATATYTKGGNEGFFDAIPFS
jgi:Protein tyrosine and serine/threonine kinase